MIQELLYTSASKGLKAGSRGFCTVLSTQGMSAPLAAALEGLSGYRPLFSPTDPKHKDNPVVHSHLTFAVGGRRVNVLSRIADYGLDYTQRTNKLAHHVVVDPENQPAAGPAWLLARSEFMRTTWEGEPRVIPVRQSAPSGDATAGICTHWQQATGDAGWAGVLAEAFLADPKRMAFLVCPVGLDPLPLIAEAIALLSRERRWDVTFSTYFTSIPPNANCAWRFLIEGTPEVHQSRRYVQALRLDLTRQLGEATGGDLVETARTGRRSTRPTSLPDPRDAPPPLAGDPRQPAGDGSYRLQRVREVDHPPLLGMESRRRRQRRGMPIVALLLVFLLVSAGIGIGAWVWKSKTPSAAAKQVANDSGQEQDASRIAGPPAVSQTNDAEPPPTTERAAVDTGHVDGKSASDGIAAQPPSDDESAPTPIDALDQADSPHADSKSDLTVGASSSADTSAPDSDEAMEPELRLSHIQLPSWTEPDTETSAFLEVPLPAVPAEEIVLRLLAPSNFNGLLRPDETSTLQDLILNYFNVETAVPAERIARVAVHTQEGQSARIRFEWVGRPVRREELRWCVLAVGSNKSLGDRFVLHAQGNNDQSIRELNTQISLPKIALPTKERSNRTPQFNLDPVVLRIDGRMVTLEVTAKRSDKNPLEFQFLLPSLKDLGVELQTIMLDSISREELPILRAQCDLKKRELRFEFGDLTDCRTEFVRRCRTKLDEVQGQYAIAEIPKDEEPNPDAWFNSLTVLQTKRGDWERAVGAARDQIAKKTKEARESDTERLEKLDAFVHGCLQDAERLLNLRRNLDAAVIHSARIYYAVTDTSEGTPRQPDVEVDILRIDPPTQSSETDPNPPDTAKK